MSMSILLDFLHVKLSAELFDTVTANRFVEHLPCTVDLVGWGKELYGSIGADLGEENPVSNIPPGGLAYTNHGNYFCIFFGQAPAWPVEHIGRIVEPWEDVLRSSLRRVTVSKT
ncbi:MAG: hypothetical protein GF401_11490 [Chitinivibrionales bacterium]|nr:hypothetical protein [Chitinivibrionales bacterium]